MLHFVTNPYIVIVYLTLLASNCLTVLYKKLYFRKILVSLQKTELDTEHKKYVFEFFSSNMIKKHGMVFSQNLL